MSIETLTEEQHGHLLLTEVAVTGPDAPSPEPGNTGWNVDCTWCGATLATLLDTKADALEVLDEVSHECTTEACGCPTHLVQDEGHQPGCAEAQQ